MSISKFKKSETLFLSLFIMLSSISPFSSHPPPASLSSPFTSPSILLLHSFSVPPQLSFFHLSLSPSPLWRLLRLGGSEQGWRIGDSVLSLQHTRELQRDIGDHGCETASVCRLYVRHTKSLYLSPQLPPLMQPQEWDVERKGM